ncbi:hypothetical protein [Rhizobium sp. SL86]|uniref:hypothetical protein n=1 Tax=Rhizobium sp. SL86 TaxID=2995148 RepID=UPI0022738F44|nr:hypothetical protein [Rhizobium sp. SL86]MCY1664161.1 hypothetical protein [Rhizobium sp. SL86]
MEGTKTWWQSKTVWGGLVAVAAALAKASGAEISFADQNAITDAVINLMGAVGGLLAIYGRLCARASIRNE